MLRTKRLLDLEPSEAHLELNGAIFHDLWASEKVENRKR